LGVQRVHVSYWALTASYLVATFFNNFLPSNIGGDVIRIRDTARITGSKTLATTVILLDRGVGLLGLVLVAALGATAAAEMRQTVGPVSVWALWAGLGAALAVAYPFVFAPDRIGQLLRPLRALHPEWFGDRINRFTAVLSRFRGSPRALANCFIGAMGVQAVFIAFYAAIASSLGIHVAVMHLAILVPLSFVIQMVPLSVNGFGVRETVFVSYLSHVGIPKESALLLSLIGAALIMVFSVSGAITYVSRRHH
jgi:hypothetical protein